MSSVLTWLCSESKMTIYRTQPGPWLPQHGVERANFSAISFNWLHTGILI